MITRYAVRKGGGLPEPEHNDIFIPKHKMEFDQGTLYVGIFCVPEAYKRWLYHLPMGAFIPIEEASLRTWIEDRAPFPRQTLNGDPNIWPPFEAWRADGELIRFSPGLRIMTQLMGDSLPRLPLPDLKTLNSAPNSTHCASCKAELKTWNSGWSIGKYCPICEK